MLYLEIKGSPYWIRWPDPLHYVDTNDSPPSFCSYKSHINCDDDFCVVGAIHNYTYRLDNFLNFTKESSEEALKFLIHFIGDQVDVKCKDLNNI